MPNDYTPPPLPDHPEPRHMRWSELERKAISEYGHACAEHVRAPLLARIAELEAENQTLTLECGGAEEESGMLEEELQKSYDEIDRLRAALSAKDGEVEALRNKSRAFRNRLVSALTEAGTGEYELRVATAEAAVNEFEDAFDAAIAARKGAEGDRLGGGE